MRTGPKTALFILAGACLLAVLASCSRSRPNRNPAGEAFPRVSGTSLDGQPTVIPDDYAGAPVLLLIGYKMEAQFDLDRWLIGLTQTATPVRVVEIPTIEGMLPGLYAGTIDEGMRKGIPPEDWAAVVTVYEDAEKIARFTGTQRPRSGRIALLDAEGRVVWFHDHGFSADKLKELQAALDGLKPKN